MGEQLALTLEDEDPGDRSGVPLRPALPVPTEGGEAFDDPARFFEPWWPGAHASLRRVGQQLDMHTDHLSDPLAVFPELQLISGGFTADGLLLEGTLLALDREGRPDAALLRRMLSGASDPSESAEGAFVASDLLYVEGRSLARASFAERRRQMAAVLSDSAHGVVGRGLIGEGVTMAHAAASMGLGSISARQLDASWRPGPAGEAWLRLRTDAPPTSDTKPFLVLLERLPFDA